MNATTPTWPDTPPVAPAQTNGWEVCLVTAMRDRPNNWKVIAKRNGNAIHADRLDASQVENFDAAKRWQS